MGTVLAATICGLLTLAQFVQAQRSVVEQFRQVERQERHLRAVLPDANIRDL